MGYSRDDGSVGQAGGRAWDDRLWEEHGFALSARGLGVLAVLAVPVLALVDWLA